MHLVNLLNLQKDERIKSIIPIAKFEESWYLNMVTKNGLIKKTSLKEYSNPRKGGIIAINLKEGDSLIEVILTQDGEELIVASKGGMAVKFKGDQIRPVGRNSMGVRAIRLVDDEVIGVTRANDTLLTITENGYGKRTKVDDYRLINRGGKGVINIKTSERNGKVAGVRSVTDKDDLIFVTQNGILIRTSAKDISTIGRNTQGLRIMKLNDGDKVISVAKVIGED